MSIGVSVVCNAYNHEKYIRSALDGFVMQKTTFPFEVLVHDDASTDRTAEIIREYEIKYPDIIKPIYSTENQYSKNDGSLSRIQYGRVQGKYIALCEGDDYWTDPLKLQKQYDLLESHPEIDMCATAAKTERNGEIVGRIAPASEKVIFSTEEVILGGGGFVATASLMYRTNVRKEALPFFDVIRLDFTTQIAGSLRGGMLYIPEESCVYRLSTQGSWTSRMAGKLDKQKAHAKLVEKMLMCFDEDTMGKYHNAIMKKIQKNHFSESVIQRDYRTICAKENDELLREVSILKRLFFRFGSCFPKVADCIWDMIHKER